MIVEQLTAVDQIDFHMRERPIWVLRSLGIQVGTDLEFGEAAGFRNSRFLLPARPPHSGTLSSCFRPARRIQELQVLASGLRAAFRNSKFLLQACAPHSGIPGS